jgi:hypothetical protein
MRKLLSFFHDGIRILYESRRPRSFRTAFGDTEARRGSPGRGCEESTSPGTEAKEAAETRGPRLRRVGLETRRLSHLASDLLEGQPLSDDLGYRQIEPIRVIHGIFFGKEAA